MDALADAVAFDPDIGDGRRGRGGKERQAKCEAAQRHSITTGKRIPTRKHAMVNAR
jgi:hypothetical protein